jgi:GT2 family glycosyltransferase
MSSKKILDLSIIVPFKDHSDLTISCLESLHAFADPIKEILLISNNSSPNELSAVKFAAKRFKNTKVLIYDHPFNFQKINNWGADQAQGSVIFFLNNDVELMACSGALLRNMYYKAQEPDVGAVGCVLLYEDNKTIQHAGVFLVPGGTADHLYIGQKLSVVESKLENKAYHYDSRKNLDVSAVTAAAVMVETAKFKAINGFNEDFIICGGDVDLCLRLNDRGHMSLLIGSNSGYMVHKESRSRSSIGIPYIDFIESYKSYVKHFDLVIGDPYLEWAKVPHE